MPPQGPPQTRPFLFEIGRSETGCLGWGSESLIYSLVLACATGGYSRARGGCLWKRRYLRSRFVAGEALFAASTPQSGIIGNSKKNRPEWKCAENEPPLNAHWLTCHKRHKTPSGNYPACLLRLGALNYCIFLYAVCFFLPL